MYVRWVRAVAGLEAALDQIFAPAVRMNEMKDLVLAACGHTLALRQALVKFLLEHTPSTASCAMQTVSVSQETHKVAFAGRIRQRASSKQYSPGDEVDPRACRPPRASIYSRAAESGTAHLLSIHAEHDITTPA